jgi:two-component system, chemotaxis family, sensor kinase CheA
MVDNLRFDLDPEEVEIYCQESEELIQQLDRDLLEIEQGANDPALIQRLFRAAHTLKGSAGTIGHHRMASLTHCMETVLEPLRQGQAAVPPPLLDTLLEAVDMLRLLGSEVSSGEHSGVNPEALIAKLQAFAPVDQARIAEPAADPLEVAPAVGLANRERLLVTASIASDSIAPAARAMQVWMILAECGTIAACDPPYAAIDRGASIARVEIQVVTDLTLGEVRRRLELVGELSRVEVTSVEEAVESISDPVASKSGAAPAKTGSSNVKTVRTSVERLDKLMNLVGELVTDRNRLLQTHTSLKLYYKDNDQLSELAQAISHMASITDELQEEVMRARMLPLENVFNKFPRMVRDLARDAGKLVNLHISGQDTELDRSVIEEIADPLMHLLRNSLDHGIEPPEERKAAGKPEYGVVTLAGRSEGSHIIITVADDGRGINYEVVRKSAVAKGLLTEDAAARLTETEVKDLIFLPGLSTAKKITDVSGRGVGMDVVRNNIERLHGTVKIESRLGHGTTFELSLPLTLAIMPVLLVSLNDGTFCIPLSSITEVLNVSPESVHKVDRGEVVMWRDRLLPLLRLRKIFVLENGNGNGATSPVVAVRWGDEHVGLVVDRLLGQQEIVIKSLGHLIGQVSGISGGTILGDGSAALILDVHSLIKQSAARG